MTRHDIYVRPEIEADLKSIGKSHRTRMLSVLENRSSESPERYGKPLGGNLKGLRGLRIGDYRIAYQVEENGVIVWAILHRKEICREMVKRYRE